MKKTVKPLSFLSLNVVSTSGKSTGRVTMKRGSKRLYFDYYRNGVRTEITSGLKDSVEGREEAQNMLKIILDEIEEGGFCFAEAFPRASGKLKALHAQFDKRTYTPPASPTPPTPTPESLTFGQYVEGIQKGKGWRHRVLATYSEGKKARYTQALDDRLLSYFGEKNFFEISGVEIEVYIGSLVWRDTKKVGQRLSGSRVRNILTVLNAVLLSAWEEYRWTTLPDPFNYLRKKNIVPKKKKTPPPVFRFKTWMSLLSQMDPFYRPIAEFMLMTGMIGSELAGLRKKDIEGDYIHVCNKKVQSIECEELKNEYRERRIPITAALRRILDTLIARSEGDYVLMMHDGKRYSHTRFKDNVWEPAFKKARVAYARPYGARHTFAAWAMTINVDINKLERLMGHNSKQMLIETYGKYVEGLEEDREQILAYFGADFVRRDAKPSLKLVHRASESFSESLGDKAFGFACI